MSIIFGQAHSTDVKFSMDDRASTLAIRIENTSDDPSNDRDAVWINTNTGVPKKALVKSHELDVYQLLTALISDLWENPGFLPWLAGFCTVWFVRLVVTSCPCSQSKDVA